MHSAMAILTGKDSQNTMIAHINIDKIGLQNTFAVSVASSFRITLSFVKMQLAC